MLFRSWERIAAANIHGAVNLYEAARRHGVRRIVFASSNHVTGFYRQDQVISPRDPVRPDGFYGLSKAFGEDLAQLYWDRFGLETVSVRIGSAFAAPKDRRMLATWMSFDDTERLFMAALTAPVVGHSIVYGLSDNTTAWWDNTPARHLGYRPQDSSEVFRAEVEATVRPLFSARRYGDPALGQLDLRCAVQIRTGAESGAEMGAYEQLRQPQREANLRDALDEYLRLGLTAGLHYAN